jgi:hypothetical protein
MAGCDADFFLMYGTAIVRGKVVRFQLPPVLAKAHKRHATTQMSDEEVINFVESKRRALALRRAQPYLENRSWYLHPQARDLAAQ